MSLYRRAVKRDANEAAIIAALRTAGATVEQLSAKGIPDLVVGFNGVNYLMEIKTERGELTPDQFKFFETWEGHVEVVRTIEDALRIIGRV